MLRRCIYVMQVREWFVQNIKSFMLLLFIRLLFLVLLRLLQPSHCWHYSTVLWRLLIWQLYAQYCCYFCILITVVALVVFAVVVCVVALNITGPLACLHIRSLVHGILHPTTANQYPVGNHIVPLKYLSLQVPQPTLLIFLKYSCFAGSACICISHQLSTANQAAETIRQSDIQSVRQSGSRAASQPARFSRDSLLCIRLYHELS